MHLGVGQQGGAACHKGPGNVALAGHPAGLQRQGKGAQRVLVLLLQGSQVAAQAAQIRLVAAGQHGGNIQIFVAFLRHFKGAGAHQQRGIRPVPHQVVGHVGGLHGGDQRNAHIAVIGVRLLGGGNHQPLPGQEAVGAQQRLIVGHALHGVGVVAGQQQAAALGCEGVDGFHVRVGQIAHRGKNRQQVVLLQRHILVAQGEVGHLEIVAAQ